MSDYRQFPFFPPTQTPGQGGPQSGFPGFPGFPGSPSQPGGQPGGDSGAAPTGPPPSFTPQQEQFQTYAVDPGSIRGCLYRFTYVWLTGIESFWFFPVYVGQRSISGFRWNGFRWFYYGVDLRRIESFQCY